MLPLSLFATAVCIAQSGQAADNTVSLQFASSNVSSSTGAISYVDPSVQITVTSGRSTDVGYTFVGVFADYARVTGEFTEIDPFVGISWTLEKDILLNTSLTLVHNLEKPVSLAGEVTIAKSYTSLSGLTMKPRVSWQPQWVFSGTDGHYFSAGMGAIWKPAGWSTVQLEADVSAVYDTGAYGADAGTSYHVKPSLRWVVGKNVSLSIGPNLHWSKTGRLNTVFRTNFQLSF